MLSRGQPENLRSDAGKRALQLCGSGRKDVLSGGLATVVGGRTPVSYTHLDVYKRQSAQCRAALYGSVTSLYPPLAVPLQI